MKLRCSKCGKQKATKAFYRRSDVPRGYRSICKSCEKTRDDANPVRRAKRLASSREYGRDYRRKNAAYFTNYRKNYKNDKQRARKTRKKWLRRNPSQRLRAAIAARLRLLLTNKSHYLGCFRLLGYSLSELKQHLESQFQPGMTWQNYGDWHVDHKTPVARFQFNSPADPQFTACWSLQNLQPLWAADNLRKGCRDTPKGS